MYNICPNGNVKKNGVLPILIPTYLYVLNLKIKSFIDLKYIFNYLPN